ncbi:MAG: 4-aminobutyrate--2-oxoglutarate transaminase, partial [Cryobacterium sp.]
MTDILTPAAVPASSAPVYTVVQERRIVSAIPGPKSVELHQRRLEVVSGGVASMLPIYMHK